MKIYSILNDFAFQWIFNQPGREPILKSLLNAILHLQGADRIVEIQYLNPFNPARFEDRKKSIVDIKVKDELGRWYEVEAQVIRDPSFVERTAFYVATLYANQAKRGEDFSQLTSATGISILNFRLFPESQKVQEIFRFRNDDGNIILNDTMTLHYLDLTRFNRKRPEELRTPLEKWLQMMKFSRAYARMKVDLNEIFPEDKEIAMAITEHQKINADEEMRRRMEDREREAFDMAVIKGAAFKQGKLEGKAEGKLEGKLEGKAEGKFEIAGNLYKLGRPLEEICTATGLGLDELKIYLAALSRQ